MSYTSLTSAVKSCDVNVGYSTRLQSDRFLNPNLAVCPTWQGYDSAGRKVCADSYKVQGQQAGGCFSAEDRVLVEIGHRPRYFEYITLDAKGLKGTPAYMNTMQYANEKLNQKELSDSLKYTGQFGTATSGDFDAQLTTSCGYYPKNQAQAQLAQARRQAASLQEGYKSNQYRRASGFGCRAR